MEINWSWFVIGFIPYAFHWQRGKNEHLVRVRALFWRLSVHSQKGQRSWELSIPLIEHWPQGR